MFQRRLGVGVSFWNKRRFARPFFFSKRSECTCRKASYLESNFVFDLDFPSFRSYPPTPHPPIEPCAGTTGLDRGGGCSRTTNWGLYLFDELDTGLEVHAEIDEGPLDTLALVLFLFQHEHVVVEKLLQFLIGEVDAKLLKAVELDTRTGGGARNQAD